MAVAACSGPTGLGTAEGIAATIVGARESDELQGTPARDVIVARSGDELIEGEDGRDVVCSGRGQDRIRGGDAWATSVVAPEATCLQAGEGKDQLLGGSTMTAWSDDMSRPGASGAS